MAFPWSDRSIAELKRLYDLGLSAGNTAWEMSRTFGELITRNAIIGKISRLKWGRENQPPHTPKSSQKGPPKTKFRARPLRHNHFIPPMAPLVQPIDLPPERSPNPVTLMELEAHHCRWPLSDAADPEFMFCGAHKLDGSSYCSRHYRMAYVHRNRETDAERQARIRAARRGYQERLSGEAAE